jgi:hypothetical protein
MKSPCGRLGVPQNADARQLREAYQALARRHEGNARRMREINDAYDAILLSRGGGGDEALALLECVPEDQRGGEWHYRMGCVQRGRGWLEEAETRFAYAALSDPKKKKYSAALNRARRDRSGKSAKNGLDDAAIEACCECCCECCGESACESICSGC